MTGDLHSHLNTEYHKFAEERCNDFLQQESKGTNIFKAVNVQHERTADENRRRMMLIVKTIFLDRIILHCVEMMIVVL